MRCGLIFAKYRRDPVGQRRAAIHTASITFHDAAKEKRQLVLLGFLLVLLAAAVSKFWLTDEKRYPPGILVRSEPRQALIKSPKPWKRGERLIVPMARFSLEARVLGKESYWLDAGADISPIDLALGWGPMSDQSVLDQLEIAQGNRRYVMVPSGDRLPLPWPALMAHSSNMHMIPADEQVENTLKSLRTGEIIELSGYLVGIQQGGQWTWVSSLSRTDTGDGACEIVWLERLTVRR